MVSINFAIIVNCQVKQAFMRKIGKAPTQVPPSGDSSEAAGRAANPDIPEERQKGSLVKGILLWKKPFDHLTNQPLYIPIFT